MSDWVKQYFDDVDAMDMDAFLAHHTDDAVVEFANNPPAKGWDEIRGAIGGLWGAIGGLRHDRRNLWSVHGGAVQEAVCTYTTKGGTEVPIAVTSILHRDGDKVDNLRIYIDMAPLFEQIAAET